MVSISFRKIAIPVYSDFRHFVLKVFERLRSSLATNAGEGATCGGGNNKRGLGEFMAKRVGGKLAIE